MFFVCKHHSYGPILPKTRVPPPLLLLVFQLQRNFPRSPVIPPAISRYFFVGNQTIPLKNSREFRFPTLPVIIIHLDPIKPKASPQNQIGKMEIFLGCDTLPVTATTRTITCLVGNSYKPSFSTGAGMPTIKRFH